MAQANRSKKSQRVVLQNVATPKIDFVFYIILRFTKHEDRISQNEAIDVAADMKRQNLEKNYYKNER